MSESGQSHGGGEHGSALPQDLPRIGTGAVVLATIAFLALLAGLFVLGYLPHRTQQKELREAAAAVRSSKPLVNVSLPTRQTEAGDLTLPGEVEAYQHTSLFPRTNGYLKRLLVDIGDHVKEGALLAEIDTPEVDAQLAQSRANVQNMQANISRTQSDVALAKLTLDRYENVVNTSGVTQQQVDEKRTQYNQSKANLDSAIAALKSAQAEVQRLEALQAFEKVVAPFSGTITARNYDLGALLSPTTTGAGREMFQIDETDKLRVFVNVPQNYSTMIRLGQSGDLLVKNYPGQAFAGKVVRTAGAIDPSTRTLRVEVDVSNGQNLLFAGMYGQVRFSIEPINPPFVIPTSALVYNAQGLHVATINENKVHFQKVSVGRDLGNELEIDHGLTGGEWVVTNPGEHLAEGVEVQVAAPPKPTAPRLAESEHRRE